MKEQFIEYYTVKQIDNSRLMRPANPARVQDFGKRVAIGMAMAAGLLLYTWQHFECIQIRYQIEQLSSDRAKAEQLNQQLHLEVATLRSPMRVDAIAHNQLGLIVPVPGQVEPVNESNDGVVAQARTVALQSRP